MLRTPWTDKWINDKIAGLKKKTGKFPTINENITNQKWGYTPKLVVCWLEGIVPAETVI
jgi:hypothetical protein